MAKVAEQISNLSTQIITDMGYELVGIEHQKSGRHSVLRVYIDSEHGIGLADCEAVSRQLSAIFDVEEPISSAYNLEVSSPGADRPLFKIEHYQRFLGADVRLKLVRALEGRRKFNGAIHKVSEVDNSIELITDIGSVALPLEMIEAANLVADF